MFDSFVSSAKFVVSALPDVDGLNFSFFVAGVCSVQGNPVTAWKVLALQRGL